MNQPDPRHGPVYNYATGPVGIQAANVTGSQVTMHGASIASVAELATAVADLRAQLDGARDAGAVDPDTHQAAAVELTAAQTALRSPDAGEQRRSVLALKRLSGLVSGATSLATKVADLLAAAGRLF